MPPVDELLAAPPAPPMPPVDELLAVLDELLDELLAVLDELLDELLTVLLDDSPPELPVVVPEPSLPQ
jgi:hypothetical protein